MFLLYSGILLLCAVLFVRAAQTDIKNRRISNALNLSLFAAALTMGLISWISGQSFWFSLIIPLGLGALTLSLLTILFHFNLLGGGDVKFLAASAVLAGPAFYVTFILHTALLGGLVAGTMLIRQRLCTPGPELELSEQKPDSVPYGVAIAGAGLLLCVQKLTFNV